MAGKSTSNAYSASPDIRVVDGKVHMVYMESDTEGGYDPQNTKWDVFYNNNFATFTLPEEGGVFLPIILKNR